MWNILMEMGWKRRRLNLKTWNWYCSSHERELGNTSMLLPSHGTYLLAFGEFHRLAARSGYQHTDSPYFYGGLSQIAGGQSCWPRMMMYQLDDATKRVRFALALLCAYIRSCFFIYDGYLSSLRSLVVVITCSNCIGAIAGASLALRQQQRVEIAK